MDSMPKIMDMLDWNLPPQIQCQGRALARNINNLKPFLQPLTPKYNQNIWENCAIILAERSDEELEPYLVEMLEWLQDMNWPGAFYILDRIQKYADKNSFCVAFKYCVERAKLQNDEIWENNLNRVVG